MQLALVAFPFLTCRCVAFCSRASDRTVDHDDDDEGEHDRRDCPPGQDQQGNYFG
jgi:hypothetical protein